MDWFTLDPKKARYESTAGAYEHGQAFLLMPTGAVVVCGHMTCASKVDAERMSLLKFFGRRGSDRGWLSREALEAMR